MYVEFENKCRTIRATLSLPSYDWRSWGTELKMSLTTLTIITWICFLLGNRKQGWVVWRRRCRWGKIWRTCAVALSSLLLSLLSPPPLLPLCPTLQHRPYRGGWRNAACWIPAWYIPCRGLFRQWSIARQWQSRSGAVTQQGHGTGQCLLRIPVQDSTWPKSTNKIHTSILTLWDI